MRALLVAVLITLAGCATDAPREPIIVTQRVEVPVPVKCELSYPEKPSQRVPTVPKEGTAYAKAQAALQELEDQRWYSKKLEAVMKKCAKDIDEK